MLWVTFFIFGLLASLGALILELLLASFFIDPSTLGSAFVPSTFSLLLFAIIEEASKIVFFLQATRRTATSSRPLSTGIAFGIGFASLEYFALSYIQNLPSGPLYGILLVHLITSIFLAFFVSKYQSKKALLILLACLATLHFGYNILL